MTEITSKQAQKLLNKVDVTRYSGPNLLSNSPIARRKGRSTSKLSARAVTKSGQRATEQHKVLAALKRYTNCTSAELAKAYGFNRYVPGRRLSELARAGLVEACDEDHRRKCKVTGKLCFTWSVR